MVSDLSVIVPKSWKIVPNILAKKKAGLAKLIVNPNKRKIKLLLDEMP